jgi:phage terminase Nu1 subunit (DNA packaging protein)
VAIRWYQGRLAELLPVLGDLVRSPSLDPSDHSLSAALAVAAAMAGDRRRAAGVLAALCGHDLANLPRSSSWLATMNGIVEAAYLLEDAATSARAYELLSPYADQPMMVGLGVACFGSVHHALGVASLTTGHVDRAVEHLGAAIRANLALAHWPAVVTSRVRYAQARYRRGGPADLAAVRRELESAAAEAAALGIAVPEGMFEPAQLTVVCTRQGRNWRVELGRRSVIVEHSVGMVHLATLIANPGQEIPALDLVGGLATLSAVAERVGTSAQPVLDRAAAREYRIRLSRLRAEIDELESRDDQERAARARIERDWLMAELAGAAGLGGRIRRFPDSAERARVAAGKAIRRALTRIAEADDQIGAHLRNAVHTGLRCSYLPG